MAVLMLTDGDWEIRFNAETSGWHLLAAGGWAPKTSSFKAGGYYSLPTMAHGNQPRFTAFDNVLEVLSVKLMFPADVPDIIVNQIDMLEELLKVRAPRYFTDRRCHEPVWLERQMDGETGTAYALVNLGDITLPDNMWNAHVHSRGVLFPIQVAIERQPFWLGAAPGEAQADIEVSAEQDWDYNLTWAEESTAPASDVFCGLPDRYDNIWVGGASEILMYNGASWASQSTSPVVISGCITSLAILKNDDILFGDDGQIIKRDVGGTWSVETTSPSGPITSIIEADSGELFAGDVGAIWKRNTSGSWSVDSSLPAGAVYSLLQVSNGKVIAGGTGEILRQADPPTSTDTQDLLQDRLNNAEQYNSSAYAPPTNEDIDVFNYNYVGLRFSITIPVGSHINSAKLRLMQRGTSVDGTSLAAKIYCEDSDDAPAFASTNNNLSSRTLTTAYVPWQRTGKDRKNRWFWSPDFSNALQEVCDRGGRSASFDVAVIVKCDNTTYSSNHANRRQVWDWNGCNDQAPALQVTYTTGTGGTWEVISTLPTGNVRSIIELKDRSLILAGEEGQILGSDDFGDTWGELDTTPTNECRALFEDELGYVWAGDNGNILKSADSGRSFSVDSTLPTGYVEVIGGENAAHDLRAGDSGGARVLIRDYSDILTLGISDTTDDQAFIANKHCESNLTNIKVDDGGVFSDIYPIASYPQELLPTTFAVNDAIYFGCDTTLDNTGTFTNLVFDIATPASATTSYTIVWEYYDGGSWSTLTCLDETEDFSQPGVRTVVWKAPTDWATTAVDSDTAYWIRARVSALTGTPTAPTQQNRDIYSCIWPGVLVESDQLLGNIGSLVQIRLHNRSDGTSGGPGGSEPTLYANRIVGGVKLVDDHENFRPFINFADEQNVAGITIDVTVDPDSATAIQDDGNFSSATGRRVLVDASVAESGNGLDNWEDRVSVAFGPTIARDYYGTYKVFLRCKQQGGTAGEVNLRIKAVGGSGGVTTITDAQETESTTDHEVVEFDSPITLPVSAQMTPDELGDETSLIVQVKFSANDADLYLYDIILIPTDQVWFDIEDNSNNAESSVEHGRRLLIDSVTIPKSPTRAIVQKVTDGTHAATWVVDSNGRVNLPPGEDLKLWIVGMHTSTTGSTYTWHSDPELLHSIKIAKVDRWLLGRGEG